MNIPSNLGAATRITLESEIVGLVKNVINSKFQLNDRKWHLNDVSDGINVYTDKKLSPITEFKDSVLSKDDLKMIIKN